MTNAMEVTERPDSDGDHKVDLVVETLGLTKHYGSHRVAVDDLTMRVRRGEVYGFLGPNGAGKTTTLRMILGLIRPTSGVATVLGQKPGTWTGLSRIGAMVETPAFYPYLSGRDNLRLLARYNALDDKSADSALDTVGLDGRGRDKFKAYSLGMKQRLGIAAALLKDPELLILDEPTNGLDPQGVVDVRSLIRSLGAQGKSLLISSHLLSEVEQVADRVGIIQRGRLLAEGPVDDLRGNGGVAIKAAPHELAIRVLAEVAGEPPSEVTDGALVVRLGLEAIPRITAALVNAGVQVFDVRPFERSLEQVFLQLTAGDKEI